MSANQKSDLTQDELQLLIVEYDKVLSQTHATCQMVVHRIELKIQDRAQIELRIKN